MPPNLSGTGMKYIGMRRVDKVKNPKVPSQPTAENKENTSNYFFFSRLMTDCCLRQDRFVSISVCCRPKIDFSCPATKIKQFGSTGRELGSSSSKSICSNPITKSYPKNFGQEPRYFTRNMKVNILKDAGTFTAAMCET